MGRILEQYIKTLEAKRTACVTFPNTEKFSLVDIHARLLNMTLHEECSRDDMVMLSSLIKLCESCIAYEDALVMSMDKCKAEGNTALYDLFSQLESIFAEDIIG